MIDPALLDEFYDYIVQDNSKNLNKMELKEDAPLTASIAFDHYKKITADAEKRGIEI